MRVVQQTMGWENREKTPAHLEVKLNCPCHISQLFEGIAQVAVGLGKVGIYPNALLHGHTQRGTETGTERETDRHTNAKREKRTRDKHLRTGGGYERNIYLICIFLRVDVLLCSMS